MQQRLHLCLVDPRKPRHPRCPIASHPDDLLYRQPLGHIQERRKRRRRPHPIRSVANRALALVNLRSQPSAPVRRNQSARPRHLRRVHIQDARFRVHRRTAPLRPAVKSWENHRLPVQGQRHKLPIADECPELLHRPCMRLGSAGRQHVLRQTLPCKRLRRIRLRLRRRSSLARHRACWIRMLVNGKQRLPRHPIK